MQPEMLCHSPPCMTIYANPSTRSQWSTNQCVSVSGNSRSQLIVTSRQSRSTPGIYTDVQVSPQTHYRVEVCGQSLQCAKAFVFVYDPLTKMRLIPNYSLLPSGPNASVCAEFTSPCPVGHMPSVSLWLGVLFTGPPRNGQQFCVERLQLTNVSAGGSAGAPPSSSAAACPYQGHPQPPCASAACCTQDEDSQSDSCADSDSSISDDEECGVYYHHRKEVDMGTTDPYYTYSTTPTAPATAPYSGTCPMPMPSAATIPMTCPASHTQPVAPATCAIPAGNHTASTNTSELVCISDLQASLGTLIEQMKG